MAIFLDGLHNKIIYEFGYKYNTLRSRSDKGVQQRRQKWFYPQRYARIRLLYLFGTDRDTAWDFYVARKGSAEKFTWFLPVSDAYTYEYVGQGDGSTTTFDIKGKDISSYTVYTDKVAQTEGSGDDYLIGDGTGTDGRDQIIYNSAPSSGELIEVSYTGILGLDYVFVEDHLTRGDFQLALYNWGLEIIEDKAA